MRILLIALALLVAAGGADWVAWRVLTGRLRDSFAQWTETMRTQGWKVSSMAPVSGGFPFAATITLPNFSLTGGENAVPAGIDWTADQVDLSLTWAHPGRLQIEPTGREVLRISRSPQIAFSADQVTAWIPLGRLDGPGAAKADLVAEAISGGIAGSRHPQDVTVEHLDLALDVVRDAARRTNATLRLHARAIALPDTGRWPLGGTVAALSADTFLSSPSLDQGNPDTAQISAGNDDAASAAAAWRDGKGEVAIHGFDLKWGPLTLGLEAHLGLDDKLQPAGSGSARAAGYDEALDALSRGRTIPPGVADTAKAILGLMGRAPADNAPGLELPFTLKNSTLSLGKIPLTKVNTVDWGRV